MGWLIAFTVLLLLASVPLGAEICFDSSGLLVRIIVGFFRFTVFPFPKRKQKPKEKAAEPSKSAKTEKTADQASTKSEAERKGGSLRDFLPFVDVMLDFMKQFRRSLRVDHLQLKLVLAGDDPCDLAVNYGRAWAALGNLMPMLDRILVIGKRDCEVECDFTASETLVTVRMDLTLRFGQLVSMGAVYGVRLLKELLIFKKKRKGGAVS